MRFEGIRLIEGYQSEALYPQSYGHLVRSPGGHFLVNQELQDTKTVDVEKGPYHSIASPYSIFACFNQSNRSVFFTLLVLIFLGVPIDSRLYTWVCR
ncbi:MAG: hypothetical protein GQ530_02450 [Desulfuromonadales bacterium]|nr:hypothetical protein [Desulfuromonadales bacterium]